MTKRDTIEAKLFLLGLGSRRECRNLVRDHFVCIDGVEIEDPYAPFPPQAKELVVNGENVPLQTEIYAIMNKPAGYECSHKPGIYPSVYELLPARWSTMEVHSAGRLDVDTTGLLIFSNNGDFIHHFESPKKELGKTYEIFPEEPMTKTQFGSLRGGVNLRGEKGVFKPISLEQLDNEWVRMEIREGKYHQVKRMLAAVKARVARLRRVAIGTIVLGPDFEEGTWRELTPADFEALGWKH
jgi:16S rRNA pseudouridine516 synthase